MDPVFRRRAELGVKLAFLALGALLAVAFGLMVWRDRSYQPVGEPVAQPIPFSHKHHVGDDGIDCRYCHTTVERSAFAGLPSSGICLSCHSQLYTDQAVLRPLRESAASGRPIAWRRVHQLPDFVFFDHSVHVTRGVACVECHGRVDQMPLTWRVAPLQMQWCLGCHRNPGPHLHPREQVFSMQAATPPTAQDVQRLEQLMQLPDTRRLTDCSTCHR
ncbi:cytochrome c3 family protein [Azohydromonas caseinilytica]|uniref:Cytochrome c3 family protein n=1 Tax=Azohydromonas caseinilytica TaxID=2728836 RepID=A0A848FJB2_9BURK|nr:cytochrome c3 family protein [Azohydromonas caseinilytica]NML17911.1 cytochrome c3 family protein [Azohydromonas caseinilytica]